MDLPDSVDQRIQTPLDIHFAFGAQGEAVHPLVDTEVGKDRFNDPQPSGVEALPLFAIELRLHLIDQVPWLALHRNGKIPARGARLAQTARPPWAGGTVLDARLVDLIGTMPVDLVAGLATQFLALRTKNYPSGRIEIEVSHGEATWLEVKTLPAVDALFETLLIGKARVAFSESTVGDVRLDLLSLADRQALERMIVAIRSRCFSSK